MSAPAPELLSAAQAGDRAAEERLIVENSRLIWSVVRRYTGRGAEQEDLYQLGCIGFLKAIHGFDPDFGTQFSTYAVPKIAGEMRRFLRDDGRTELSAALGREPVLSELAEYLTLEPEDIAMAETATASVTSLSAETGDGLTLESVLGDEGMEDALVEQLDLRAAIARLPERERTVIDLRYFRAFTQERTARVIGVSQVQVSRIERRAVERLRRMLES